MSTKYIIDRRTWLRGEGGKLSYLLRLDDGKMCCLGQCALQDGYTKEELVSYTTPSGINYMRFLGKNNISKVLMAINDDPTISDQVREAELIRLAKTLDMEWEFIN